MNKSDPEAMTSGLVTELTALLNRHSEERNSGTPDFILAEFLIGCLDQWNIAVQAREKWHGRAFNRYDGEECLIAEAER